jgi:glutamate carboxypeptidase
MRQHLVQIQVLSLLVCLGCASAISVNGSETERAIVARVGEQYDEAVEDLAGSVDIMSATENFEGLRELSDFYAERFAAIGFDVAWVPLPPETGRAGHFVATKEGSRGPGILMIGHLDTVLEGEPWRREGDVAWGSGIADMKGGNLVILAALRALHSEGLLDDRRIIVVFTGDEESPGHPIEVSRAALVDAARRSEIALGYETAVGNTAVTGRRGISTWTLTTTGETGHSSGIFSESRGSGAIYEAARILASFHDELREPNLTYNASVIVGGTDVSFDAEEHAGTAQGKTNVVAQRAVVEGDLRFLTREQLERAIDTMQSIVANHLPRTSAAIEFSEGYPPMAPTEGNRALLARLDEVSRDLGYGAIEEFDPARRGAADTSFVAEYNDTIDGLGVHGSRTHAPGESMDLSTLRQQIERSAVLVYRLSRSDER